MSFFTSITKYSWKETRKYKKTLKKEKERKFIENLTEEEKI